LKRLSEQSDPNGQLKKLIFAASGIKTRQCNMTKEIEIVCPPGQHEDEAVLTSLASAAANIPAKNITGIKILKRSIDARGRKVLYRMQVRVFVNEPVQTEIYNHQYKNVKDAKRVIIVGAGPAGIFAALQCIEQGLKTVIL
jgi:hypothetical protein